MISVCDQNNCMNILGLNMLGVIVITHVEGGKRSGPTYCVYRLFKCFHREHLLKHCQSNLSELVESLRIVTHRNVKSFALKELR